MKKILKISVVFILVLSMVISMGLSSYTAEPDEVSYYEGEVISEEREEQLTDLLDESLIDSEESEEVIDEEIPEANPGDPEDPPVDPEDPPVDPEDPPVDPEDPPVDPEDPPVDPEDPPVDPEDPPVDPEDPPVDPEDPPVNPEVPPVNPEIPQNPVELNMIDYTIRYFLDGIEQIEWEIYDQVPIDNPIVEMVPHDYIPEGYIIDEEFSTPLPFIVSETENVIEIYYVLEHNMMLMALPSYYESDTPIFPLYDTSTNDHTKTQFAWMFEGDLYLALYSHPTKPIVGIEYNGITIAPISIDRANNTNNPLIIQRTGYAPETYYVSSTANPRPLWTVINLGSGLTLSSKFELYIDAGAGGHNITTTVYIANSLLVYHSYEGVTPILDTLQSGSLSSSLGYSVYPIYEYNGQLYELDYIEVIHNGIFHGYMYPWNLVSGYLTGNVTPLGFNASGEIIFYYKKAADGELTIAKNVSGSGSYDGNQEFDIFVYGPNGKTYVVTLRDGESVTLTGLEYGDYRVEEIVPMNYRLVDITDGGIVTIDRYNKQESVTVSNEHSNDGWFWDDDEKINNFSVGESDNHSSLPINDNLLYTKLDYFIIPATMEIDNRSNNV